MTEDALCHIAYRGQVYNGRPALEVMTWRGATALDVTSYRHGLVGRGVLLDVPRFRGVDWLEPGEAVPRARQRDTAGTAGGRSPGCRARQPPRRRAYVRRTRRKLPPRNGETPVEPQPLTAGHPGRSFPLNCSRPVLAAHGRGRQAWRAEGAPLKP
jgi:hypothetical protein